MTKLFKEFEEVSAKAWKQKIQMDLKGADYNETLIWTSPEGIHVKPFYHQDNDIKSLQNTTGETWDICDTIFVTDAHDANKKACDILERGATSLKFIIASEKTDLKNLLTNIPNDVYVCIECQFLNSNYLYKYSDALSKSNVIVLTDIIGHLARHGNWFDSLKSDHDQFDAIFKQYNTLTVDLSLYQNAGANMMQQLAYALAHTNEYLNHISNTKNFSKPQDIKIIFTVSVGSNYFFEIAKLRALRSLWSSLAKEYDLPDKCLLFAVPTKRNKTLYDYNTNMLRTTTECMSAILGGADIINNRAYDSLYHKTNEFGERIARNQLLILKHESYFNEVNNPCDGSYYIESLTTDLAQKALILFKEIEAQGGFLSQLKQGTIQRKIKEQANKEQEQFDKGEITLLGTNKHPNPNDRMKDQLELYPFVKFNKRKTLIEPIIEKRLAENSEQERLKTE